MQLFVEHLTVIDSAYLHPEHGIVGESWIVDVTLHGDLDPQSMVMDFGHVKKQLKAAIDDSVDHTLIVPAQSANLTVAQGEQLTLTYQFGNGESLEHGSPASAVTLLDAEEVTDEALVAWLETYVMRAVPSNVTRVEISLRHEDAAPTHYHYAHGLKKHDGNCQRIAHGHRSRIMVFKNGKRSGRHERAIAADWAYAYVATLSDRIGEKDGYSVFAYTSDQGRFTLAYPTARCRFLATDSTVECIAQHWAAKLNADGAATYTVRAYEGVHKGAIA